MSRFEGSRFEVLQDKLGLWNVLEENFNGWYIGCSGLSKRQANRRRQILTQQFGMMEVRVRGLGLAFVCVDANDRCLGNAYGTVAECRKAYNLMAFEAMGGYAPKERSRNRRDRFGRVLRDEVV